MPAARFWSFTLYDNRTRSISRPHSGTRGREARATPAPRQVQGDGAVLVRRG
ncbi:hypothetical protein [Streptomyces cacaoi]|uniref:hypothetical protein n=1 Tax=Streptomyces cacaoi TaxID=1898 RepID=UPI00374992BB